jgi:hypothetical protein
LAHAARQPAQDGILPLKPPVRMVSSSFPWILCGLIIWVFMDITAIQAHLLMLSLSKVLYLSTRLSKHLGPSLPTCQS